MTQAAIPKTLLAIVGDAIIVSAFDEKLATVTNPRRDFTKQCVSLFQAPAIKATSLEKIAKAYQERIEQAHEDIEATINAPASSGVAWYRGWPQARALHLPPPSLRQ